MDLSSWRHEYRAEILRKHDLAPTPMAQLKIWITQLQERGFPEPNAMVLTTVDAQSQPSSRTVLLKGLNEAGLVFYTNYGSKKAQQMAHNPLVSVLFPWHPVERQVKITGKVQPVSREESIAYFAKRPRDSQLGAWASSQSMEIASQEELEAQLEEVKARFEGQEIPLPEKWGGYRIEPKEVEFWQGGLARLHNRLLYRRLGEGLGDGWQVVRLQP